MRKSTQTGGNRTGIESSRLDEEVMLEGARAASPNPGDGREIHDARVEVAREAEPVGTMPPSSSLRAARKAAKGAARVKRAAPLVDKLGERIAFERTGVRLYEALLSKLEAGGGFEGGPARADLERLRDQELSHFQLVFRAVRSLGGDPTAETPSADIVGVAASGMLSAIDDPRTTLAQSLQIMLVAELTDSDAWGILVELAKRFAERELAKQFEAARLVEAEHLDLLRTWVAASVMTKSSGREAA
jgi:rubrerythrin